MKTKGIVLIAIGTPEYLKMAYNLAVSIKSVEDLPITLVYNNNLVKDYLSADKAKVFDNLVECPSEFYTRKSGGNSFVKAKVHLYGLSPYDCTLFLDSDTAWNPYKKPSDLFDELAGINITFKNTGYYSVTEGKGYDNENYTYWFDIPEMLKAYKIKAENVYQIQSELFYFERSKAVKRFFDDAIRVYEKPKVVSKLLFGKQNITDEMAFSISLALNDLKPHQINWLPTFWNFLSKDRIDANPSLFTEKYYALSIGGMYTPQYIMTFYNNIIKKAFNKKGGIPFTIKPKTKQN